MKIKIKNSPISKCQYLAHMVRFQSSTVTPTKCDSHLGRGLGEWVHLSVGELDWLSMELLLSLISFGSSSETIMKTL